MKTIDPKTTAPPKATRGKYSNLLAKGTNVAVIDPALLPYFPDSASVNRALHAFLAINQQVQSASSRSRIRKSAQTDATGFDPRAGTDESSTPTPRAGTRAA